MFLGVRQCRVARLAAAPQTHCRVTLVVTCLCAASAALSAAAPIMELSVRVTFGETRNTVVQAVMRELPDYEF
ncbi:hypothetical protein BHE74_00021376 [Ensete ventricosum]|nr:hypothetical protein BHE74_00021376 [Ensete ventricosum]RZR82011.1 hypothetical protein BHM03_00008347 [Ensete ventricosum]